MDEDEAVVKITQEDDQWVAQGIRVDIASQGATRDQAHKNWLEAVALYFEETGNA